jgi:hypothetical protein
MHALFGVEVQNFAPAFRINRPSDATSLHPSDDNENSINTSTHKDLSLQVSSQANREAPSLNMPLLDLHLSQKKLPADSISEQNLLSGKSLLRGTVLKKGAAPSRCESQRAENQNATIRVFVPMQWERL